MAEFAEVIRQFDRMCKANPGCIKCPLNTPPSAADKCSIAVFVSEPDVIEQKVMTWAAEHPEPKYPTWGQWLQRLYNNTNYAGIFITPIPADIAEKLGIEPKEDA